MLKQSKIDFYTFDVKDIDLLNMKVYIGVIVKMQNYLIG